MAYTIAELSTYIENYLQKKIIEVPSPSLLDSVKAYMLTLPSKRIRPLLTLLSYQLFDQYIPHIIAPAIAVELLHNFTLIHDDIMDKAPLRRGKPTIHTKWDVNTAILAGDAMMAHSFSCLSNVANAKEVMPIFCQCLVKICEGQQKDLSFEKKIFVTEKEYLAMIYQKTAALIGLSMQFGALVSRSKPSYNRLLKEIGCSLGMGFQLQDDLLDLYAHENFGKKIGGDIINNKKTYLLVKAFSLANTQQKNTLLKLLQATSFEDEKKIDNIKTIFNELNIYNLTQKKIQHYIKHAYILLDKLDVPKKSKDVLHSFIDTSINGRSM